MNPIEFNEVAKSYRQHQALKNISLSIPPDSTTAIIGPSGSGKSTCLQLINGLVRPDHGEVQVFQERIDYAQLPKLRRRIGYAVQGTGLFPHLTVAGNISLLAQMEAWPVPVISERVAALMDLVDLPAAFTGKYPHELSGGEQQRVGLCRAMMLDPPIFLLDEPFGALDPITRAEIHMEFEKLQKAASRTIVLVTHDLREALKLADLLVILNRGEVAQIGTPKDILRAPASDFVGKFTHLHLADDVTGHDS